ncbi:MAG: MaoC family dehydratase [Caulobacter sp.]|nr:MaoC family dehydratase [Caulobacter sp.]
MAGMFFEDMSVGQSAELTRTVDDKAIQAFAEVSGDFNPVHLDEAFAATTPFKTRIAHGMLSAAYISALIAGKLPGPGAIYLGQTLTFRRPVKIGDEVVVSATITALDPEKARATLATVCTVGGKTVLDGEATIMVPRRTA